MAQKIECPKCGVENYSTDAICLECGQSLIQARAPAAQDAPERDEAAAAEPKDEPDAGKQAKAGMPLLWRVLLVSVIAGLIEVALIAVITRGDTKPGPITVFFIPLYSLGIVLRILLGTLLYGGIRGLMLHFLLQFTNWPPGAAGAIGGAIGFGCITGGIGFITVLVGLIIGYSIGIIAEGER